jgi:hypothetical protein
MRARKGYRRPCGAVIVLIAIFLIPFLAFVAFVVDIGYIAVVRGQLQNAADAAALAAARVLPDEKSGAQAAKSAAALHLAGGRTVKIDAKTEMEFGQWDDASATFSPNTKMNRAYSAVRCTCQQTDAKGNALPLFFSRVLGTDVADVRVTAVAKREGSPCGRFIGIDWIVAKSGYTDSYNSDAGSYFAQAPGDEGNLCSDGPIELGNEIVNGNANPGDGYQVNLQNSSVSGSMRSHPRPIDAPPIDASQAIAVNDNHLLSETYYDEATGSFQVTGGETVEVPGGVYYLAGDLRINGEVILKGPTQIYVAGSSVVAGRGLVNQSLKPADLEFYTLGSEVRYAGSANFYGVFYAPAADVVVTGNAEYFGSIVGKTLTLSTNGGAHYDEALGYANKYLDGRPKLKE